MAGGSLAPWLALREDADAGARSTELVQRLRSLLDEHRPAVIHDLGCGTGSMGRWLAPRLPGPQHWVLHDRDPDLLRRAAANFPGAAAGGAAVTVRTRHGDVTRLAPADGAAPLAGATLVTASALLDLLTADGLEQLVAACVSARCSALVTLSVTGSVELSPAEPLDARVGAAFNDHQRRATAAGRLLGPDAVEAAVTAFRRAGAQVLVRPSPWRLGSADRALAGSWFAGWVAAAVEARPELHAPTRGYVGRRLTALRAGRLAVTVHHADLLAVPS
ncbi:MAG TPA: class I SAM-dependent methyltransferase [Segeticoccus sp.]|nr:class I SAM-dependent methyltransferase [Segeticoccus sp.]